MLLVKNFLLVCLTFVLVRTYEDDDGFDLSDAFKDDPAKPRGDDDGFDLSDAFKDDPAKPRDDSDGFDLNDALKDDPTKPPSNDDFDLSDALNGDPVKPAAGSSFDDSDLQDVVNSDYKPEKTKSKAQDPPTVIDIVIDLVMALIGGTSEQVKKLCFSLLEMFTEQFMNVQDQ